MAQLKNLIVTGDSRMVGSFYGDNVNLTGTLRLTNQTDASGTAQNNVPLIVGEQTGTHVEFDNNEIMSKGSGTTTGPLYINADGGDVYINGVRVPHTYFGTAEPSASIGATGDIYIQKTS